MGTVFPNRQGRPGEAADGRQPDRSGDGLLRVGDPDRFAWRHWDGELVFFDDLSGETRLIHGWAGIILERIAAGQPVSMATIESELAAAADLPREKCRDGIRDAIDTLRGYGLICDE
jgi:PqqD family protein of HPr-rel-A system